MKLRTHRPTKRQVEIIRLLWSGLTEKQVATDLGISVKTVDNHLVFLYRDAGLHNRADLFRYAASVGAFGVTERTTREIEVLGKVYRLIGEAQRLIKRTFPATTIAPG